MPALICHCEERPLIPSSSRDVAISMRLNTRRRTAVAKATGLPRYARNDKVGTHEHPAALNKRKKCSVYEYSQLKWLVWADTRAYRLAAATEFSSRMALSVSGLGALPISTFWTVSQDRSTSAITSSSDWSMSIGMPIWAHD